MKHYQHKKSKEIFEFGYEFISQKLKGKRVCLFDVKERTVQTLTISKYNELTEYQLKILFNEIRLICKLKKK